MLEQDRYILACEVLGDDREIEISNSQYLEIEEAIRCLLQIFAVEEKLDVLVENYLELQIDLLSVAARHSLHPLEVAEVKGTDEIRLLNRRIVNLFMSTKMYRDQTRVNLGNMFGPQSEELRRFDKDIVDQYDASLAFRALDALRNHVQHFGLPIHRFTWNSKWIGPLEGEEKTDRKMYFSSYPYVRVAELAKNPKFKKTILEELIEVGDDVPLYPMISEYVELLCEVHSRLRKSIAADVNRWDRSVLNARATFEERFPEDNSLIGFVAAVKKPNEAWGESIGLSDRVVKYRLDLERRNSNFVNLSRRVISTEIPKR